MGFENASIVFMTTGTMLFAVELIVKRINIVLALLLVGASIFWSVLAMKYWGIYFVSEFGESFSWLSMLLPIIGITSAMTILMKGQELNAK